jgi:hypothetical protein
VKSFMARQHQRPRAYKDRVGSGSCLTVGGCRKLPTRMRELPLYGAFPLADRPSSQTVCDSRRSPPVRGRHYVVRGPSGRKADFQKQLLRSQAFHCDRSGYGPLRNSSSP